jgi:hypothetical protein
VSTEQLFDTKTRNRIIVAAFGLLVAATMIDEAGRLIDVWRSRAAAAQKQWVDELSPRGAIIADLGVALLDAVTPDRPHR